MERMERKYKVYLIWCLIVENWWLGDFFGKINFPSFLGNFFLDFTLFGYSRISLLNEKPYKFTITIKKIPTKQTVTPKNRALTTKRFNYLEQAKQILFNMQAYHQNQFIIINTLLFSVFYFAAQ
jgi:hypothetical protein